MLNGLSKIVEVWNFKNLMHISEFLHNLQHIFLLIYQTINRPFMCINNQNTVFYNNIINYGSVGYAVLYRILKLQVIAQIQNPIFSKGLMSQVPNLLMTSF